jgi:hypothetical protein
MVERSPAQVTPVSDYIIGIMLAALGLVGLLMASRARDEEIFIFGCGLALFAVLFDFGLIRAHYDRKESGDE